MTWAKDHWYAEDAKPAPRPRFRLPDWTRRLLRNPVSVTSEYMRSAGRAAQPGRTNAASY